MRTIASHRGLRPNRGFTLIEILVVMLIIGILATAISLSVGHRTVEDRMEAESRRMEQLLRLAFDEALAKGLDLGLRQTYDGFEFMAPDPQTQSWAIVNEGLFRPRQLPPPFLIELRIDERLIDPVRPATAEQLSPDAQGDGSLNLENDEQAVEPQILILSSGEMTAFTLDLKMKGHPAWYRLEADSFGQMSTGRLEADEFAL